METTLSEGKLDLNLDPTDSLHDAIDGMISVSDSSLLVKGLQSVLVASVRKNVVAAIDHLFASSVSSMLDAMHQS